MLFNSFEFVFFFAFVLFAYYQCKHDEQNWLLLIASCVFYGWWDWRFLGLVAFSAVTDYSVALALAREQDGAQRKRLLAISLVSNLGLLGFFKYYNFFADSAEHVLRSFGMQPDPLTLQIVLPVGISFYTFQSLSYTIDVYRRQLEPCRNPRDFAVFLLFFPQLVAGPIERATHMLPQFARPRHASTAMIREGLWLILFGFYKKVVLADNLSSFTGRVFGHPADVHGFEVVLAVYAFAFQIYGDFSGYSDIARGTARLLGFDLMHNFRMPYLSTTPSEYWQRWHISLSSWLRDYLYVSLGGNRHGRYKTYRNLMLTMLLGGLWHGAAWNFVAWGAYQGALLCGHRALAGKTPPEQRDAPLTLTRLIKAGLFFQLVCAGWLLFAVHDLRDVATLAHQLVSPFEFNGKAALVNLIVFAAPVIAIDLASFHSGSMEAIKSWPRPARIAIYACLFGLIVLSGRPGGQDFIYFQF
jgi:alginate O-acetyltransferase complex protein AlgI